MTSTRIESRLGSWFLPSCTLAVAVVCAGISVVRSDVDWLVAALMPALLFAVFMIARRPRFAATVSEEGLQLDATGETVRFDEIDSLVAPTNRRRRFPMTLVVGRRRIEIPARLNLPSSEVRDLLLGAIPRREQVPFDPQLAEYYAALGERFGSDRVWHVAGRDSQPRPRGSRMAGWVLAAIFVASVVYIGYGGAAHRDALGAIGGLGVVVSAVGALVVAILASGRKGLRSRRDYSLIISPVGLALRQAALKGELRWEEIRAVRFRPRPAHLSVGPEGAGAGSDLEVAGAVIKILDVYDQPLDVIHRRIASNWQESA